MSHLFRIASRVFNTPLLVLPGTAEVIASLLASRADLDAPLDAESFSSAVAGAEARRTPEASRFVGEAQGHRDADGFFASDGYSLTQDGVAIVPIIGELVHRGAWIGASSGLVSYEGIQHTLRTARANPRTRAILLDVESPGGEAVGCFEAAAAVRALAAELPVHAVVNGMAASAGYAIPSGANRVVTVPSGLSGSIGVVMLHVDQSQRLAKLGLKPTLIFAGAHKVDGNGLEPLPETVRADLQAECDRFYGLFVDTVTAGRPGLSTDAIRATEARTFIGQEAVAAGLADETGTFDDALAALTRDLRGRPSPARTSMDNQNQPAPSATVDADAVRREATVAAQARIKAITTCDEAKGREALASHFAFDTAMSAEDAQKALAAAPKGGAGDLIATMNATQQPNLGAGGGQAEATADKPLPAQDIYDARAKAAAGRRPF